MHWRSWSAYYKWLQHGKWSWVALGGSTGTAGGGLVFPQTGWFLIFDDTFIYRSSSKAPGYGVYHQHSRKANRPRYARGQNWVTMALSIAGNGRFAAIPLLSRLILANGGRRQTVCRQGSNSGHCPCFWPQKSSTVSQN